MRYRIALCGFSEFECRAMLFSFQHGEPLAGAEYEIVESLRHADFAVVDADSGPAVKGVVLSNRVADAVFVGTSAPAGATLLLPRPIDPPRIRRALDELSAQRQAPRPEPPPDSVLPTLDDVVAAPPPARRPIPTPMPIPLRRPAPSATPVAAAATGPATPTPAMPVPRPLPRGMPAPIGTGKAMPAPPAAPKVVPIQRPAPAPMSRRATELESNLMPTMPMYQRPLPRTPPIAEPPARITELPVVTEQVVEPLATVAELSPVRDLLAPVAEPPAPALPPDPAHLVAKAAARAAARRARLANVRRGSHETVPLKDVLVLDADPAALQQLCELLARFGFDAHPVHTVTQVDEQIAARPFAAFFLDIALDGADRGEGLALVQRIHALPVEVGYPVPAVLVVSARLQPADRVRAALAGFSTPLEKPVSRGAAARALEANGVALPADARRS